MPASTRNRPGGSRGRQGDDEGGDGAKEVGERGRGRPRGVLRERPYSLPANPERIGEHYARKRRQRARDPRPPHGSLLDPWTRAGEPLRASEVAADLRRLESRVQGILGEHEPYDVEQILHGLCQDARQRGLRWRHRARRPGPELVAEGVLAAWRRLRRGAALLPR